MSRTRKSLPRYSRWYFHGYPTSMARQWRQQLRAAANHALRIARDYDTLQVPHRIWECSSEYDWT